MSSIFCKRCQTGLVRCFKEDGLTKYTCKCSSVKRVLFTCNYCKKKFLNFPYLKRKTNYCSLKCYWTGTNKKHLRICKSCQKEFYVVDTLVKKGFGFYCSKQCKKIFTVSKSTYKRRPKFCSKTCKDNFERDYVSRICRGCKKQFELPRSSLNRGHGSYCSWECYKHFKGETSIEQRIRIELEKLKEPFKQEIRFGRFRADFYLPNRNLIIECDGSYWHRDIKIKERDKRKDKFLQALGYKIIRFSEESIRNYNPELLEKLLVN